nr:Radical SAM domain protein [Kibdelosporangium sp. MJ126-NF4]
MEQNGVATAQDDLNEDFALFLLEPQLLTKLAGGEFEGVSADSHPAACARWALRYRADLFDEQGRHYFNSKHSQNNAALVGLARPFLIDPDREAIENVDTAPIAEVYRTFYDRVDLAGRWPDGTRLVGISVPMGPELIPALILAELLKKIQPDVRIVLGGPTISLMEPEDIEHLLSSNPAVDCVVRFDGEFPLLELSRQVLDEHWQPGTSAGVSSHVGAKVKHTPPGVGPNLNVLPPPIYPENILGRLVDPLVPISQARGCYWGKCDYCDFVELFDGSPAFRGRHVVGFVDEIAHHIAVNNARRFAFITESLPPAFARRACQLIVDRGMDIAWHSFVMVDRRFDSELLELMVRSGCDHLVIGMETMTTRVLKLVHKSADREENIRFLKEAKQAGIRLNVNLIPNLPSTTYDEAMRSLEDVQALSDGIERIAVFPFEVTKSSGVGRAPDQFGLQVQNGMDEKGIFQYGLNHVAISDPAMTDNERAEVFRRFREFAAEVNSRSTSAFDEHLPDSTSVLRIAIKNMDIRVLNGDLACTHIKTQRTFRLGRSLAAILRPYLDGGRFTLAELRQRIGTDSADVLVKSLQRARVLELASMPSGDELAERVHSRV